MPINNKNNLIMRTIACVISFILIGLYFPKNISAIDVRNFFLPVNEIQKDEVLDKLLRVRDVFILKTLQNPIKRIEYYLKLSDEQMMKSERLVEMGEIERATKIALRAENYYTELVTEYKWILWVNKDVSDNLKQDILYAPQKHQEIVSFIISRVNQKDKGIFEQILNFSERNNQELQNVLNAVNKEE